MYPVPLTYLFDFENVSDRMRPYVMHEFAANHAQHLVLTDTLISQILERETLRDTLQKEMADEGLTFVDAHAPFGRERDMNTLDPARRKSMYLWQTLALEIAASMGVKTITIHVGNNYGSSPEAGSISRHCANIEETLSVLLPEAEKRGLIICIENIWFQTNAPDRLLEFKRKFPTDALGFCYDAGHANLMDNGRKFDVCAARDAWGRVGITDVPWENRALEKMLPHVVNCHLHDNNGQTDQHRLLGRGCIDWKHIAGLLRTAPRLMCIQSEVIPVREKESIHDICETFRQWFPEAR